MPCDQIRRITVNLDVADRDLLFKALVALDRSPVRQTDGGIAFYTARGSGAVVTPTGQLRVPTNQLDVELPAIKTAYTAQSVAFAAQRFGWRVTATTTPTHLTLSR